MHCFYIEKKPVKFIYSLNCRFDLCTVLMSKVGDESVGNHCLLNMLLTLM